MPHGLDLTLTDVSPGMVEAAKGLRTVAPEQTTVLCMVADAACLPFPDRRFDATLAMHMLYHVKEPAVALRELQRVRRSRGRCLVTVNGEDNMIELRALAERVFGPLDEGWGGRNHDLDDVERLTAHVFGTVERHELQDVMVVTDPGDLVTYLLSLPQAERADTKMCQAVERHVESAMRDNDGTFQITKRLGIVVGHVPV